MRASKDLNEIGYSSSRACANKRGVHAQANCPSNGSFFRLLQRGSCPRCQPCNSMWSTSWMHFREACATSNMLNTNFCILTESLPTVSSKSRSLRKHPPALTKSLKALKLANKTLPLAASTKQQAKAHVCGHTNPAWKAEVTPQLWGTIGACVEGV